MKSPVILLTHSYFLRFDPKQEAAHMPYPPLGTLYAAGMLRAHDFSVALHDGQMDPSEAPLGDALRLHAPDILVIYDDDFNYLNKMCLTRMREAAFAMSAMAKQHGVRVIVHGSDAADHADAYLDHDADAVVIGEGERTLTELCTAIRQNSDDWSSISGLAYRHNGVTVRTAKRPVVQELDALPMPAWDLVDWTRYRSEWMQHHGTFSVNMVTTRGCPYHCNWCAKPIYGQVYNSRSPEHVVQELTELRRIARPDHIWFADDIFGLKPGWIREFARIVNEQGVRTPFKIQSRADLLNREGEIEALREAGCTEVWIGAESGSQRILDAMEKGITLAQIASARRKLREHGIAACFFLQFGYRGETEEDIRATMDMVEELMPDNIGISVSYPLPGTKFYDTVAEEMGEKRNWSDSDDLTLMYRGTFSPDYYRRLHRFVHRRFRLRQGITMLKEVMSLRLRLQRSAVRRMLLVPYYSIAVSIDRLMLRLLASGR